MKTRSLSPFLAATAAAALYATHDQAHAATVTYTNAALISIFGDGPHTIPISPDIQNADALLGISDGNIGGPEGGDFTVAVEYADTSSQQIFNSTWSSGGSYSLNTMPGQSFATGDIIGLIFNLSGNVGASQLFIPAGTVFSFDVLAVPEPTTASLIVFGALGLWTTTRRKSR